MINKTFFKKLKKEYDESTVQRRKIISQSNNILHESKRVIFALHRGDVAGAGETLKEIENALISLDKQFSHHRINDEGAYKAAVEEYAEAKLFHLVLTKQKIDKFPKVNLDHESYIGGLSDLTGELVRLATNTAAKGNYAEVAKIKDLVEDIMAELVEFDITGYLRTKYDQAKTNMRKLEQINYDIRIRKSED